MLAHNACKIVVSGLSHKLPPSSAPIGGRRRQRCFRDPDQPESPSKIAADDARRSLDEKSGDFPPAGARE